MITQLYPTVPHLKEIPKSKWQLVQQQSLLIEILKELPLLPYRTGRSLRNTCENKIITMKFRVNICS